MVENLTCRLRRALLVGSVILSSGLHALAQNDNPIANDLTSAAAIRLENPPQESIWSVGIRIKAVSASSNIRAVFPVPMDWPEQTVEMLGEQKSEGVETQYLELDGAKLMAVTVSQLGANQEAEVLIKARIKKQSILPPLEIATLVVPKKLQGDLKTFIQESPFIETTDRKVRELAKSIDLSAPSHDWGKVEKIYDEIRTRFPYEFDPQIRSCADAIKNGKGDCEELTSLFIAVCRINKIPARAVWVHSHTYAEFYLIDEQDVGHWFPCQLAGTRMFGEMQEEKPIFQKGDKFTLPFDRKPARYVAPQLMAEIGNVTLQFIAQPVPTTPQ